MDRRQFVSASILAAALGTRAAPGAEPSQPASGARPGNPIAVSTYSFWRFQDGAKLSIEACIDRAGAMGFDAVELLEMQMDRKDNAYLQMLKRRALVNGLPLCGLSTHQGFVTPDREKRKENVTKTIASIELAYALGIPTIRVNTGRWGTSKRL